MDLKQSLFQFRRSPAQWLAGADLHSGLCRAFRVAAARFGQLGHAVALRVLGRGLAGYAGSVIFRFVLLFAALGAGYFCTRLLEGLPWRALGLGFHAGWLRDLLVGSAIGIASLTVATAIATAGGGLTFTFSGRSTTLQVGRDARLLRPAFVLAALAEEALFRGYPLQTLTRARLVGLGIFVTSFGLQQSIWAIKSPRDASLS